MVKIQLCLYSYLFSTPFFDENICFEPFSCLQEVATFHPDILDKVEGQIFFEQIFDKHRLIPRSYVTNPLFYMFNIYKSQPPVRFDDAEEKKHPVCKFDLFGII